MPTTYMNDSGRSVGEAMRFFKLDLKAIVVMHDEMDLAPAKARIKVGGGNAGHNGLRSITAHVGNDYKRLRLGIGHPGAKELVLPFVLGDFSKAEMGWVERALRRDRGFRRAARQGRGRQVPEQGASGASGRRRRRRGGLR